MEEIDVMYPLGGGSHIDDLELRYSLRSIHKHIAGVRNIYLIGKCPPWVTGCIHIPAEDEHPCKETNIYRKIMIACNTPEISDNFLFFNDDHFMLRNIVASEFPFIYKGNLTHTLAKLPTYSKYSTCVHKTAIALRSRGFGELNFDTHTPIIYNKRKFADIMPTYDWSERFSYVVKSLYANSVGVEGVKELDGKMDDKPSVEEFYRRLEDKICFSVGNNAIGQTLDTVWNELYPTASPWER